MQAKPLTAYEAAIAAATDTEKERLQAIRLQFDIPPNSPEWGFYSVLAPLIGAGTDDKTLAAFAEQLDRIEQRVDDAAKQPPAAIDATMYARLERIEAMLRRGSPAADPVGGVLRYFFAFAAGALVCEVVFLAISNRWLPPIFGLVGMFVLGLSATGAVLLWLWLEPHLKRR